MRGEWSGKVRSTPTPYEMRRTVNEARAPSPRFLMTLPSTPCARPCAPSPSFTCTRPVSPGPNPWRSFRSCAASTSRIASMTRIPFSLERGGLELLGRLAALESFHDRALLGREPRGLQQVRARPPRPPQRLHAAPARDARVVPRQEHRRHARAPELLGPRVLRRLEEPARERLALRGALRAEHAPPEPRARAGHHQRRQPAARQHGAAHRGPPG